MGRLIPAGPGMEFYRNVKVDRDETIDQAAAAADTGFDDQLADILAAAPAARTPAAVTAGDGDGAADPAAGGDE